MEALIGTYRLVDWVFTLDGVMPRHPFGADARGLLTYTADGHVWAALMHMNRPVLGTRSLLDASEHDQASAAAGYLSYAGTYRVEGDEVVHHVEVSLFPDWIGEDQRRRFRFEGDELILETPETITSQGKRAKNTLRWRRVTETEEGGS
jgi:hypothetical protein